MLQAHAQRILSERQLRIFDAADFQPGLTIVGAGAGSGKTRTAVEVIFKALTSDPGLNTMVVTMTRTAKDELVSRLKRVAEEIGYPVNSLNMKSIRTIHSLSLEFVRRNAMMTPGVDGIEVVLKQRLKKIMAKTLEEAQCEVKEDDIPNTTDICHPYLATPLKFEDAVSLLVETRAERLHACMNPVDDSFGPVARAAMEKAEALLNNSNGTMLVDYDAMIEAMRKSGAPMVRGKCFLLIDEAQDMSRSQLELVMATLNKGASVMCFGDDSQGIFGFSGACSLTLAELRRKAEDVGFVPRMFPLMQNHRSTEAIVRVSEAFLPEEDKKHRKQVSGNGVLGERVEVLLAIHPEAKTANRIVDMIKDGTKPGDMIVLQHANWKWGSADNSEDESSSGNAGTLLLKELAPKLKELGVAISIPGQTGNLAERFMCVVRALQTEREMEEEDVAAFLRSINCKIGPLVAPTIAETLQGSHDVLGDMPKYEQELVKVFKRKEAEEDDGQHKDKKQKSGTSRPLSNLVKAIEATRLAVTKLRGWADKVQNGKRPLPISAPSNWKHPVEAKHPLGVFAHMALAYFVKNPESEPTMTPESIVACCDVEMLSGETPLDALERSMSLYTKSRESTDMTLRFSTIHRFKGREAPCVFAYNLRSPFCKTTPARRATLCSEHIPGCSNVSGQAEQCCGPFKRAMQRLLTAGVAENRRLQYVAASRATQRLFLSGKGHEKYGYLDTLENLVMASSGGSLKEDEWVKV